MSKIQILDCTLRDGGYINNFTFGRHGIKKIISKLTQANVDIIECGFLEDGEYDENTSIFTTVEQIANFLPANHNNSMYVAMACYGEYSLEQLSDYDGSSIDGIRVTFHYNEIEEALDYCRQIKEKGYRVFVQPVGTSSYTDEQLITLIKKVNELHPFAFYLVDTLGLMHEQEVLRFFYLIDHNLDKSIHIGFHSHNNLQLSFSNCQALTKVETNRIISLDSSVYGMGRGAGNLNTELIAKYLNEHKNSMYEIEPLLEIVDEYILKIKAKYEWGYSVPYYLAAINGCHPNYASFLSSKQTLTVKNIASILKMITPNKRSLFDKTLAEKKYIEFQSNEIDDKETIDILSQNISGRNVMVLAPGASIRNNEKVIKDIIIRNDCITISATFVPDFLDTDFVFLSNLKRYETTFNPTQKKLNLIQTSNIITKEENKYVVNYSSLLNEEEPILDNTTIMLLNLLVKLKPSKIFICGLDGYRINENNYYQMRLEMEQNRENFMAINEAMTRKISVLQSKLDVEFVTPSIYVK